MRISKKTLSYGFTVICTAGLMFPVLSFIQSNNIDEGKTLHMKTSVDTTVMLTYIPLKNEPYAGRFEPGKQALTAIDSFVKLWNNTPSGIIQLDTSKVSKSDLFSISAMDSLLQISNTAAYRAKYMVIIKGIDPASGQLKSYLALVDSSLNIIKKSLDQTFIQDADRCPDICPQY